MSDPKTIYLQPACCADPEIGRLWCEDDAPEACEDGVPWTKYVLARQQSEPRKWDGDPACTCGQLTTCMKHDPYCAPSTVQVEPVIRRTDERFVSDFNSEYAAPPADEARELLADACELLRKGGKAQSLVAAIDAYLAKVKK